MKSKWPTLSEKWSVEKELIPSLGCLPALIPSTAVPAVTVTYRVTVTAAHVEGEDTETIDVGIVTEEVESTTMLVVEAVADDALLVTVAGGGSLVVAEVVVELSVVKDAAVLMMLEADEVAEEVADEVADDMVVSTRLLEDVIGIDAVLLVLLTVVSVVDGLAEGRLTTVEDALPRTSAGAARREAL